MINKDNAAQYLPLVQALAEGKTIQHLNSKETWMDMLAVSFSERVERYRIKPEPREIDVWISPNGTVVCVAVEGDNAAYFIALGYTKVRFKEVL